MKPRYVVSYSGRYYINVDKIVSIEADNRKAELLVEDVNSNVYTLFEGNEEHVRVVLDNLIKWICGISVSEDAIFYIKDVHKQYVDAIAESERYKEN